MAFGVLEQVGDDAVETTPIGKDKGWRLLDVDWHAAGPAGRHVAYQIAQVNSLQACSSMS